MNGDRNRIAASVSMSVEGGRVAVAEPQGRFGWGNKLALSVCLVLLGFAAVVVPGYALAESQCASLQQMYRQNQKALKLIEGQHEACAKAFNELQCNRNVDEQNEGDHAEQAKLENEMSANHCPIPKS
jgi:hypothetical protein